jgi:hypothetical protein
MSHNHVFYFPYWIVLSATSFFWILAIDSNIASFWQTYQITDIFFSSIIATFGVIFCLTSIWWFEKTPKMLYKLYKSEKLS